MSIFLLYKAICDFKRLYAISEFYDFDQVIFYKSIQSVPKNDMDMTGWLNYFVNRLETQMIEVHRHGEQVIRRNVLAEKHGLCGHILSAMRSEDRASPTALL